MNIVVGGIIERNGKFLLVQENKEICKGKWNLPAGRLNCDETILEGAKREIFEECGCKVELLGILQIGNKKINNDYMVSVIFSTKLLEEDIKFDGNEIVNVKWFSYDEILNMKEELRTYDLITDAIERYISNKGIDLSLITII